MAWIESAERNDNGQFWLEFEELGIADWATLRATEQCPSDILGEGRLVTGTFEHSSGEVLNLFIAGEATPIGSTANHPFWSEGRQDFAQAGSLNPGEHLRLADGRTTTLERTEPIAEQLPVYNLEVDGEHLCFVGESGVLVRIPPDDQEANLCVRILEMSRRFQIKPPFRLKHKRWSIPPPDGGQLFEFAVPLRDFAFISQSMEVGGQTRFNFGNDPLIEFSKL